MAEVSQCFIFAAGRGERMRPLTDSIPKPLVKIKNKPVLGHILDKLSEVSSVKKVVINTFYLADKIEEYVENLNDPRLTVSRETLKIETGGGLLFAADLIDFEQPLLLINGDILWVENSGVSDIQTLCNSWNNNDFDILLGLKKKSEILGYEGKGDFDFDVKTGALRKNDGALEREFVYVGVQIINPKILNDSPIIPFSINHFYKTRTNKDGSISRIKAAELNGKYFHIGTVDAIGLAEKNLA